MTWVGPIESVEFKSAVSGTVVTFTPAADMAVGTLVVIGWTCNVNTTAAASCGDNSVQPNTANVYTLLSGTSGTLLGGSSTYCRLTRTVLAGNTITLVLSASASRVNARMVSFTGVIASGTALEQGLNVAVQTTSPITLGPTSLVGPISAGGLAVALGFWTGGVSASGFSTATTGYTGIASTSSGGTSTRVELNAAYKQPTTTTAETDVQAFTSITRVCGQILVFKGAGGTVFTHSMTGALSFAGAVPARATSRRVTASMTPTGVVTKTPTGRTLTAGFAAAGALSRVQSLARTLTGAVLRPTGALNRSSSRTLTGGFTPTGVLTSLKLRAASLTAAFTPAGSLGRLPAKVLSGGFTPTGALSRTASVGKILTAVFSATTRSELGAIIPAYNYPSPTTKWDAWIAGAPFVKMMIADPGSPGGPGTFTDTNYQAAFAHAQANGIRILGYVDTSYTAIPLATVTGQVDLWKSLYGINDIFFDQTSSSAADSAYYQTICDYVHLTGGAKVMLNAGTNADEAYLAMCEVICLFEGSQTDYDSYVPPAYVSAYAPSKIAHLIYDVPTTTQMSADFDKAIRSRAGYAYITDDTLASFPWDTNPSYWATEILVSTTGFTKETFRILTGVFRPVGMVASSSRGALSAVFRPVGSVAHGLPARTLSAALTFVGSTPVRAMTRLLVSSLVASGVLHTRYIPPVALPLPGGGGFGMPMPDSFFTRYKPTLRRQR